MAEANSTPVFHPVRPGEEPRVAAFARELFAQDHIPYYDAAYVAALAGLLADERLGGAWLIEVGGEAVGYAVLTIGYSLEYGGLDGLVDELFVAAPRRRHGFGTATLEFLAAECQRRGVRALHLEVDHTNPNARRLYQRMGFADNERHLMTRRLDVEPERQVPG